MNKFKRFGVSILSLGLVLALNPVTTFAAEPETSVVTSESNAIGGWSEEDGYLLILKHIQKQWRMALHTLLQNIQVKQKNVHTMVHLKKSTWLDYLGWKISLHKSKNGRLGCNSY